MVEPFSVGNATRAATVWAASPVGRLVRVEVLVTVSCTLLATLVFLGSGRRTSRSAVFRFFVWMALMLCYPAVSYTIGLIQSGSFRNDLVVVWACFLIGCADGIFACSIDHSDHQSRTVLNQATQVIYVLFLLLSDVGSLKLELKVLMLLLWALNVAKLGMRLWSLLSAGRDKVLTKDNWLISNYMAQAHVRDEYDFDPETMKGYRYAVAGEKDMEKGCAEYRFEVTDDLITKERLCQPGSGRLLSSTEKAFSRKLKDMCLSLALFKLLRRRLGEKPVLHERDDVRTLVFVRRGLAGGDSSEDYERMFRVIEVELGFLFDFFYARYPSPKQSLVPETALFVSVVAVSLSTLFCPALLFYHSPTPPQSGNGDPPFVATGLDIWLARFVIVLFVILELYQYLSLVLSDWHKVKMLCRYARKPSWHGHAVWEWLLWLMCTATLTTGYWNHSVAQYSLLHACLQKELHCVARTPLLPKLIREHLMQRKAVTRRDLPVSVKCAIHRLLRSEWLSNLKYGDRALQRNWVLHDFDWATSRYNHGAGGAVGSVLVWHIATTICATEGGAIPGSCREVATTLSDYCAYLLFQAPELVTDRVYDARLLMEAIQLKIQQFLKHESCRSNEDMFNKLPGFQPGMELRDQKVDRKSCFKRKKVDKELPESLREQEVGREEYILADGIKLSRQLMDEMPDEAARWDVLSQVWVELLLSAAPSNINVTAHVKKLATGGELITQLWALLTHGGVVDKPDKPTYTL